MKQIYILFMLMIFSRLPVNAQCYPDRHSTNFFDGWISCEVAENPNPVRGKSHFILYEYDAVYKLGQVRIWNSNDPSHLDWGMQDVAIDYSTDGVTWTEAGVFTFPQASGLSTYEGAEGPYLNDIEAKYLLLTGLSNYGGECFGFAEIQIEGEEVFLSAVDPTAQLSCVEVSVFPNPFAEKVTLTLSPGCTGDLRYTLYDGLGRQLNTEVITVSNGQQKRIDLGQDLPAGTYRLFLEYGNQSVQRSIVKMNRT